MITVYDKVNKKRKVFDITGDVYGKLTVMSRDETQFWRQSRWFCKCECGRELSVFAHALRAKKNPKHNCGEC